MSIKWHRLSNDQIVDALVAAVDVQSGLHFRRDNIALQNILLSTPQYIGINRYHSYPKSLHEIFDNHGM